MKMFVKNIITLKINNMTTKENNKTIEQIIFDYMKEMADITHNLTTKDDLEYLKEKHNEFEKYVYGLSKKDNLTDTQKHIINVIIDSEMFACFFEFYNGMLEIFDEIIPTYKDKIQQMLDNACRMFEKSDIENTINIIRYMIIGLVESLGIDYKYKFTERDLKTFLLKRIINKQCKL